MPVPNYGFSYLDDFEIDDKNSDDENLLEIFQEAYAQEKIYQSNEHGLGFPVSEAPGTYNPQALNARHREILRLVVLGYKHVEIARMLGITPTVVSYTVTSPLGRSFLAEIHEARTGSVKDVHNRLKEMSPLAAEVMLDILNDGKSETNRLKAAEKILEMTGHKSENRHMHLHTHMTPEEIAEVKRTANIGPKTLSEASTKTTEDEDREETNPEAVTGS